MKNNPVFQVLVVSNATILGAGNDVTDLAVGQLGLFNAKTNKSIATTAALPPDFYFAVGLPDSNGNLGDIRKSAGETMVKALVERVLSKQYTAPAQQVISLDLSSFVPQYNEEYVLRLSFQSGQTMNLNGYSNPLKSFVYHTPNTSTGNYPLATFITNLVAAINNQDAEGLVVAADAGSSVVTITIGQEDKEYVINGINRRYDALREFKVTWGLSGGFETDGVYTISSTGPTFESGSGYDIQQMEYVAGGWIGNPGVYRDSNLNGILASQIKTYAVQATKYFEMRFHHANSYTSGGSLDYKSNLETVIAIPETTDYETLINALVTMVETYLPDAIDQVDSVDITTTTTTTTSTTTTTTTTGA